MDKVPTAVLRQKIEDTKLLIPIGSRWQHYKGDIYVVTDLVIIELTNEVAIVYIAFKHPSVKFLRPLVVWQEAVEWEGNTVFRFRMIAAG